ncbi:MAG TPA: MTH1187 family thiamine-binding protein [Holophaga sp.]|nr:MTH1187 family thiamine-binding protein [Holophaga sp.]
MHVIVDFTAVPVGTGVSLSPYIAEVERVLQASGLTHELHANGTNLEGEWDEVMAAIRQCHEALHAIGVPRVHTDLKLGTRSDRAQCMADKVTSVRRKLPPSA